MKLQSKDPNKIKSVIMNADLLLKYHSERYPSKEVTYYQFHALSFKILTIFLPKIPQLFPAAVDAIVDLVSRYGLRRVHSLVDIVKPAKATGLWGNNLHPKISAILLDCVKWRCHGYDK
jgi:hypothetical protein